MSNPFAIKSALRVVHVEGSRRDPSTFEPNELVFTQSNVVGDVSTYSWSKKLKHLHADPNIEIEVDVHTDFKTIQEVRIRLKRCEIIDFPRFEDLEPEEFQK